MTVTPRSLSAFCRTVLPHLVAATDKRRLLKTAAEVVGTDRWNSFDRFHETTRTLVRHYEHSGAKAEVEAIQTGSRIGTGRWIIQGAQDVGSATVDVVGPVRRRILDYADCPWHAVQWTASTPRQGTRAELVVIDDVEKLRLLGTEGLVGKTVLTGLDIRTNMKLFADRGASVVISDRPIARLPNAVPWTKFGWGAVPMDHATANLVGLVLSENQGSRLRRLLTRHGRLTLLTRVHSRKYVGSHDVVSGVVEGADDPQDEVWAIAHSAEPGAIDNASGVSLCVEIAHVLEDLISRGVIRRPRRSIRLINGYECYGFFAYLERAGRLQTPLAGVCIDTVGSKPSICGGRLEWHSTIPMSAGFVDWVGEAVLRSTLRRHSGGYRLSLEPFMSTADTLIGDPQYGYPCPWITTHHQERGKAFDAYHSSADTMELLSGPGLKTCAAAMAGYLYFLADAGSREVAQLATAETQRLLGQMKGESRRRLQRHEATYIQDAHGVSMKRLKRWLWGGDRGELLRHLADCEGEISQAAAGAARGQARSGRVPPAARRVPRRTAVLSPTTENVPPPLASRISGGGLSSWALFWADGRRDLAQIAGAIDCERSGLLSPHGKSGRGNEVDLERVVEYFEAHAELGYVDLPDAGSAATERQLTADLRKLGVKEGMDLMVHSSLSKIGQVEGGADTVVDALLAAIGRSGTLMMPSFNHGAARVYNPMTTPTINGAIADAMWRRREAARSLHPSHAVAAIGPKAEAYCIDHLEAGIWEQDSPIGRLIHGGGYILALGVDHWSSTAYHVAENSVPCGCIDPFGNIDRVVGADGSVDEVWGLAWREKTCLVSIDRLEESLDRRRLQKHGKVGAADCELVRALDLWEVRRQQLKKVCPTCPIKPGYRSS